MSKVIGTYGHGTENDFVLIFDPNDELSVAPDVISKICDRTSGIGSDGLIRITKIDGYWFMDYRNRDGSLAEMCGNGIRVMARYLVDRGFQNAGIFPIDTRDGRKFLSCPERGDISVNMGQVRRIDDLVTVRIGKEEWEGFNIDVGNPHAVVEVDDLQNLDLSVAPLVVPRESYPEGVNVEFIHFESDGEISMRVFERGVGETRSCGTGTCAVALTAALIKGAKLPSRWVINPPGGRLEVEIDAHSNAILTGPAVLIKEVDLGSYFE